MLSKWSLAEEKHACMRACMRIRYGTQYTTCVDHACLRVCTLRGGQPMSYERLTTVWLQATPRRLPQPCGPSAAASISIDSNEHPFTAADLHSIQAGGSPASRRLSPADRSCAGSVERREPWGKTVKSGSVKRQQGDFIPRGNA